MNFPVGIHKTQRPKFDESRFGRAWWECDVVLPDGTKVNGHYEATRGSQFYFMVGEQWYKGAIDRYDTEESRHVITPDLQNTPAMRSVKRGLTAFGGAWKGKS